MFAGVVVEELDDKLAIWDTRHSRLLFYRRCYQNVGLRRGHGIWMSVNEETKEVKESRTGVVRSYDFDENDNLIIHTRVLFPPHEIVQSRQNQVWSMDLGLIDINPQYATDLLQNALQRSTKVFDVDVHWDIRRKVFFLVDQQELIEVPELPPLIEYDKWLSKSPWAANISRTTNYSTSNITQTTNYSTSNITRTTNYSTSAVGHKNNKNVMASDSDSSPSSDNEVEDVVGIVYEKTVEHWKVFILDRDHCLRNSTMNLTMSDCRRYLSSRSTPIQIASTIRIHFDDRSERVKEIMVETSQSEVYPINRRTEAWIELSADVERIVHVNGKEILRLYNHRVGDLYDIYDLVKMQGKKEGDRVKIEVRRSMVDTRLLWTVQKVSTSPPDGMDSESKKKREKLKMKKEMRQIARSASVSNTRGYSNQSRSAVEGRNTKEELSIDDFEKKMSELSMQRERNTRNGRGNMNESLLLNLVIRFRSVLERSEAAREIVEYEDAQLRNDIMRALSSFNH